MIKTVFQICLSLAVIFAAHEGWAQTTTPPGSVSQPTLGFIVDRAHHLRPMIGVVGAASIGDSLDVGTDVLGATVPPAHDYILATTSSGSWPIMVQVRGGAVTIQPNAFAADSDQSGCDNSSDLLVQTKGRPRPACP